MQIKANDWCKWISLALSVIFLVVGVSLMVANQSTGVGIGMLLLFCFFFVVFAWLFLFKPRANGFSMDASIEDALMDKESLLSRFQWA